MEERTARPANSEAAGFLDPSVLHQCLGTLFPSLTLARDSEYRSMYRLVGFGGVSAYSVIWNCSIEEQRPHSYFIELYQTGFLHRHLLLSPFPQ